MEGKTIITQEVASRQLQQGLFYLLRAPHELRRNLDPESVLAVSTVIAYLAAYALPECNLNEAKERLLFAFEPLKNTVDTKLTINKAVQLAEVFC